MFSLLAFHLWVIVISNEINRQHFFCRFCLLIQSHVTLSYEKSIRKRFNFDFELNNWVFHFFLSLIQKKKKFFWSLIKNMKNILHCQTWQNKSIERFKVCRVERIKGERNWEMKKGKNNQATFQTQSSWIKKREWTLEYFNQRISLYLPRFDNCFSCSFDVHRHFNSLKVFISFLCFWITFRLESSTIDLMSGSFAFSLDIASLIKSISIFYMTSFRSQWQPTTFQYSFGFDKVGKEKKLRKKKYILRKDDIIIFFFSSIKDKVFIEKKWCIVEKGWISTKCQCHNKGRKLEKKGLKNGNEAYKNVMIIWIIVK